MSDKKWQMLDEAGMNDYEWAQLQRAMYANLGRFFALPGATLEQLEKRLGPQNRGTVALEIEGTETGVSGLRFRYADRLKVPSTDGGN